MGEIFVVSGRTYEVGDIQAVQQERPTAGVVLASKETIMQKKHTASVTFGNAQPLQGAGVKFDFGKLEEAINKIRNYEQE